MYDEKSHKQISGMELHVIFVIMVAETGSLIFELCWKGAELTRARNLPLITASFDRHGYLPLYLIHSLALSAYCDLVQSHKGDCFTSLKSIYSVPRAMHSGHSARRTTTTLPVEIHASVISYLLPHGSTMCAIALVNRIFHMLSMPHIYTSVDLGALQTLISKPELATHVRTARLSWNTQPMDGDGLGGRKSWTDLPLELTDAQAEKYDVNEVLRAALLRAYMPAKTALFFRLCPKLDAVDAAWARDDSFFENNFYPLISPIEASYVPVSGLQTLTTLNLRMCGNWDIYDRSSVWDAMTVLRLMLLPSIQTLSVHQIVHISGWPEEVAQALPSMHGTSPLKVLNFNNSIFGNWTNVLGDLLHVPKALTSFFYDHRSYISIDLTALGNTLVNSQSRTSLQSLTVKHSEAFYSSSTTGNIGSIAALPSLRSVDIEASFLTKSVNNEAEAESMVDMIPPVKCLSLRNLVTICKDSSVASHAVRKIIEKYGGKSLSHFQLSLNEAWGEENLASIETLCQEHSIQLA
jgi:hypothetical protein